jgi:hypothetical protein
MQWGFVWISLWLRILNIPHVFICHLHLWELSNSFPHLLIGFFLLLLLISFSSLYILDIIPLSVEWLAKIFSLSVGYLLILVIVSFHVQKLCNLMQSHLSILALIS